tara:strand:- start:384 stop:959 length:576 start_codon:yes stop_codon:yes gene_type:complete
MTRFFCITFSSLVFSFAGSFAAKKDKPVPKPPAIDIFTASLTGNLEAIKQHAAVGANLNAMEPQGGSAPLMLATLTGEIKAVALLLELDVDVNLKNGKDGATALHLATFFGYPDVVEALLQKGAKPNLKNNDGKTPLDIALPKWSTALEEVYKFVEAVLKMKLDLDRIKKVRPEIATLLRNNGGKTSQELE